MPAWMPLRPRRGRRPGRPGRRLRRTFDRYAYRARQYGLTLSLACRAPLGLVLSPNQPGFDAHVLGLLQRRYESLLERDLANVEPATTRAISSISCRCSATCASCPPPWRPAALPVAQLRERHDDLPAHVDRSRYPRYYLRTFHWQTDGWLSDRSARLYDPSVEFLFAGTADVMRRMAIPPLVEAVRGQARPRVLDVACARRFLLQLGRLCRRPSCTGSTSAPPTWRTPRRCWPAARSAW